MRIDRPGNPDYEAQVRRQIEQYAETVNMHDLPPMFHIWSNEFIRPGLEELFGVSTIPDFFKTAYRDARSESGTGTGLILSIGCGDGSVEIDLAKSLLREGVRDFRVIGADLSPILLNNMRSKIATEDLRDFVEPLEADLNLVELSQSFDMIMANHSLHHIVELEKIFDFSKSHMKDEGIFAINDMIGRNGHQRWPETAKVITDLWPLLQPKQRYHVQLKRYYESFVDHDCSLGGIDFEGIRSQDILPLMLERFYPLKFFGFGGFIDLLVDRGYGHGFDVNNPNDIAFITKYANLNETFLDSGAIKPTMMIATFSKKVVEEKFYRNRSAHSSIRRA